jgi:hypothetical protein
MNAKLRESLHRFATTLTFLWFQHKGETTFMEFFIYPAQIEAEAWIPKKRIKVRIQIEDNPSLE